MIKRSECGTNQRAKKSKGSWDIPGLLGLLSCYGHTSYVSDLELLNKRNLISCSADSKIVIWNVSNGEILKTLRGHTKPIHCVCVLLTNYKIASGSLDSTIRIWNSKTGQCISVIKKLNSIIALCFVGKKQGHFIAS
jgi:WD40 repeat protein